jgi:hypothetical protein
MTSIKKPLIAIASALALAATAFVAPANAAISAALTVNNVAVTAAATAADPVVLPVPADNSVDSADALKVVVTVAANTAVTATATNAKLISALATVSAPVTAAAGSATFSANSGSGSTVTFYVFTTKADAGSVVLTVGGDTTTYNIKGTAGAAYNLNVVAPKVANLGGTAEFTATVTDVFGNAVTNATISSTVIRGTLGAFSYDATDKRYEATLTAPATAGNAIVANTITASAVAGLAAPVVEAISTVTVADLAGQTAALSAEVVTLTAKVAELEAKLALADAKANSNKAKYNALAKKWNKKFPKAKVALLK